MGSVLELKRNLLLVGVNKGKTHPRSMSEWGYIHAELDVILQAFSIGLKKRHIKGATMYVARKDKRGKMALAMPCADCWRMLKTYRIKSVVYTTDDNWVEVRVS